MTTDDHPDDHERPSRHRGTCRWQPNERPGLGAAVLVSTGAQPNQLGVEVVMPIADPIGNVGHRVSQESLDEQPIGEQQCAHIGGRAEFEISTAQLTARITRLHIVITILSRNVTDMKRAGCEGGP